MTAQKNGELVTTAQKNSKVSDQMRLEYNFEWSSVLTFHIFVVNREVKVLEKTHPFAFVIIGSLPLADSRCRKDNPIPK
jgi:hypothetical protein